MLSAALVAALVGYGSTIALVLSAAAAVGATPLQAGSWVLALCLAKAAGSGWLSMRFRVPVLLAWSTPGAALVAATTGITMAEAVGAFLLSGVLVMLTGAVRPLGRVIALIPDSVAGAMLAGVLLPFCLRLPAAVKDAPALVPAMVAVFVAVRLWNPALAVLAALAVGTALALATGSAAPGLGAGLPALTFIAPVFRADVLVGLGLPLYLVTMASQNLPGFATLRAAGYAPPVRPALAVTGALSAGSADLIEGEFTRLDGTAPKPRTSAKPKATPRKSGRTPLAETLRRIAAGGMPARKPLTEAQAPVAEGAQFHALMHGSGHGSRSYRLYVPAVRPDGPMPLVVMLHGCTQTPEDFAIGTGMNLLAEEFGCLIAYPSQPMGANAQKCWNWFRPEDQKRDAGEPALIAGITRDIQRDYPADPARTYIAGLSAGGAAAVIVAAMGRAFH